MKKTLLAAAIAAVAFSGTSMAQNSGVAESRADELAERVDSMPQVFGNIQYAVTHTNIDNGSSSIEHGDNGTTLGVKHSHQVTPGLEGFLHLELEGIGADDKATSNGIDGLDEAFIGVRGDGFGQLWVGSDDSTYEAAIEEIANYWEVGALTQSGSYDTGEGDLIQYKSPSFSGLELRAAVQINGDGDERTDGEKSYPYQLAAVYGMGALELAVAMDSNDGNVGYSSVGADTDPNNENTYGLRASYDMNDLRVTGQYQTRDEVGDLYGVMASYSLGANVFAAGYEHGEADEGDGEIDVFSVQALHNLSDHMYVYVEGYLGDGSTDYYDQDGDVDGSQDESSVLAVGGVYYF